MPGQRPEQFVAPACWCGMSKLLAELQRLYFLPDQLTPAANGLVGDSVLEFDLVSPDATVRAMVINFAKAADWEALAKLYLALQHELDLPAPAVSVSGSKGYGLWFSLAEPVPLAQAQAFLAALRRNYLGDIPLANLELHPPVEQPAAAAPAQMQRVPALQLASGKWSAYIDPSLGSVFIDEPWLEIAPNIDQQAGILAGLESIKAADWQRALSLLQAPAEAVSQADPGIRRSRTRLNVGTHYSDPESFLLAVMNDASASPRQRIEAAKALLPYFAKGAPR